MYIAELVSQYANIKSPVLDNLTNSSPTVSLCDSVTGARLPQTTTTSSKGRPGHGDKTDDIENNGTAEKHEDGTRRTSKADRVNGHGRRHCNANLERK